MAMERRRRLPAERLPRIYGGGVASSGGWQMTHTALVWLWRCQHGSAFLESQPEIRDLSLWDIPSYPSDPFTLPPSTLPHLAPHLPRALCTMRPPLRFSKRVSTLYLSAAALLAPLAVWASPLLLPLDFRS